MVARLTNLQWDIGRRSLDLGGRPHVMGILNVTLIVFLMAGSILIPPMRYPPHCEWRMTAASIIDIGGESTRPYSEPVSESEELKRVLPVIEGLSDRVQIPISIDTSKANVARAAVAAGAEIINDVTGLEGDPEMPSVVNQYGVGVCVMHMQGTPQTMQDNPSYNDVVEEIHDYLAARLNACLQLGIPKKRICLDPGIGFGKSHAHNLQLVQNADFFLQSGVPILVGHSRKGFIGSLLGDKDTDRQAATLGVSLALASRGVHILRVHDVRETVDALKLYCTCTAESSSGRS